MRHILVLLVANLVAIGVNAQVVVSTNSLSFFMRKGLPWPNNSTRPPANQQITLTSTGPWSATITGPLSYQCSGPCLGITPSSGNGSTVVTISFLGRGTELLPEGVTSGTINIGMSAVQLTLTVLQRFAYDHFVYNPGYPSACYNSSHTYPHEDTCQFPNELPGSPIAPASEPGFSLLDESFGGRMTKLTPSGHGHQYSTISAYSARSKHLLTATRTGETRVFDRASKALVKTVHGLNINYTAWDPADDDKLWFMDNASIKTRSLKSDETVLAADYSAISSQRPSFASINMGGTADITDDSWWVYMAGTYLCAVDLNKLTPATQEEQTFCRDTSDLGIAYRDFAMVTQVDSESMKRYVVLMAMPQNHLFSISGNELKYELPIPTGPSDVTAAAHATVGQDSEGRQILLWVFNDIYGNKGYLASGFLNKGKGITRPIEEGGGLRLLYPIDPQNWNTDMHFGCNWRGNCVVSIYGNSGGVQAGNIASVAPGPDCGVTTREAHGFSSGTSVLIGGAEGVNGANGVSTISVMGPYSFSLTGRSCSGSYLNGSGNVISNVTLAPNSPNRGEIVLLRPGHEVRRLARHRTVPYNNGSRLLGYSATPRASLSRLGDFIAYDTNSGIPEEPSVWEVETGTSSDTRIRQLSVMPNATSANISYDVPLQEPAALVTVSSKPDLATDIITRQYDGQVTTNRRIVVNGLKAQTKYFYRISTPRFSFTGTFTTAFGVTRVRP